MLKFRLTSFFIAIIIVLAMQGNSSARNVAVLPLLDLSQDDNGVNFMLTEYLRAKIAEHDFEVISDADVMDFMVRNRIRNLGALTSLQFSKIRTELAAEYVLLGTVCQLGAMPAARISLSVQLIRTIDEETVWSTIRDLHPNDMISLLALRDPRSLDDVHEEYFNTLFDSLPAEYGQQGRPSHKLAIQSVFMHPQIVKPGERIEITVRIYRVDKTGQQPSFILLVDGDEYQVNVDEDAGYIKAFWQAQGETGTYDVHLVSTFPSGDEQVNILGEYRVDGTAPEVDMTIVGKKINEENYFNKELHILPRLKIPEQTSSWEIAVFDKDETLILLHEGEGALPVRIIWNGFISGTEKAPDGRYLIMVRVLDLARNAGQIEKYVNLVSNSPRIAFTVNKMPESIRLEMENETHYPLAFWYIKVYKQSGGLVAMEVGEELPSEILLELPDLQGQEKLELIFAGQDIYGNRTYQTVNDVFNLAVAEVEYDIVPESQWLENF